MKKKSILILCSLVCLFFMGGCSYKKIEFDTKSGKINTVKAGEKFTVSLIENHEQNYYWILRENSNKRAVDYLGSVFHGNKSGQVDFNFQALKTGTAEFRFNLNHYNDSTQNRIFKVEVVN